MHSFKAKRKRQSNFNIASFNSTCRKKFRSRTASDSSYPLLDDSDDNILNVSTSSSDSIGTKRFKALPAGDTVASSPILENADDKIYTFANPRPQQFSFPPTLMHHIISKPDSRESYQKLMQTCKLFFARNQVIPAWDIYYNDSDRRGWVAFWGMDNTHKKRIFLDFNEAKFLLWGRLDVQSESCDELITKLIPHVHRFELSHICISNQVMSMNEFNALTAHGKIERFIFENVVIYNADDRTLVGFDKILEKLPDVQHFEFTFGKYNPIFLPETIKNVIKILSKHKKLVSFSLHKIPQISDFDTLAAFLTKNQKFKILLYFAAPISRKFKQKLITFVDNALKHQLARLPLIKFPRQKRATFLAMKSLHS